MKSLLELCLLFPLFFIFFNTEVSFTRIFVATTIENYPDITVMEVEGDYDTEIPDADFQYEPRQAGTREFFKTHHNTSLSMTS
jgi:hypothetical protein